MPEAAIIEKEHHFSKTKVVDYQGSKTVVGQIVDDFLAISAEESMKLH